MSKKSQNPPKGKKPITEGFVPPSPVIKKKGLVPPPPPPPPPPPKGEKK